MTTATVKLEGDFINPVSLFVKINEYLHEQEAEGKPSVVWTLTVSNEREAWPKA